MGSWSVSCGISNIAITSGNKCVLLPLYKQPYQSYTYLTHTPATLPIFGEYDDYGGIESIEETENTKLISEHFGITIEEFCALLVDGKFTYGRDEAKEVVSKLTPERLKEVENWRFMWIDRQVWDFMTTQNSSDEYRLDLGNPSILKLLGFEYIKETKKERYKHLWRFGNQDFYSDDTWLEGNIYSFSDLLSKVKITEDKMWVGLKNMTQLWEHLDDNTAKQRLVPALTGRHYEGEFNDLKRIVKALKKAKLLGSDISNIDLGLDDEEDKPITLQEKYIEDFRKFGNDLAALTTLRGNLHCMSGDLTPHTLYLTPQCGDYEGHQKILEKFTEINKSYIEEYD